MTPIPHAPAAAGDEALCRAIARAVWTDIHWTMPRDREVTIAVRGDDIAVRLGAHIAQPATPAPSAP